MKSESKVSYNLSGMADPTDRQLASLMKKVAKKAEKKSATAHQNYTQSIENCVEITFQSWAGRIKSFNIAIKNTNK